VRILIATPVPRQREAGAAGVVFNHARELEKRGHTVDCWFLDDLLPGRAGLGRFAGLLFALRIAKKILKDRQAYDVVNLHAPSCCAYGLCRKFLRPRGAPPYVFTMHGSEEWITYVMLREYRLGRADNLGWKNRLWHRVYHQNMFDFSIRTTDYGTVVNRAACVIAQITYGGAPGRICYIPRSAIYRTVRKNLFSCRAITAHGRRLACYSPEAGSIAKEFATWRKRSHCFAPNFRI
jgi:hypothetical protein